MTVIDLRPFCSTEYGLTRLWLSNPFSFGEWTYATNGHAAIRVPRRDDVPANPDAPAEKVAWMFDTFYLPKPEMRPLPAFALPDKARHRCPSCDGVKVHDCPSCRCLCERCGGTRAIVDDEVSVSIGEAIFNWKYVQMLAALPGPMVPAEPPVDDAMPVSFGGGQALLMPMRTRFDVHVPEPGP